MGLKASQVMTTFYGRGFLTINKKEHKTQERQI